jgi:hypothetical protein
MNPIQIKSGKIQRRKCFQIDLKPYKLSCVTENRLKRLLNE